MSLTVSLREVNTDSEIEQLRVIRNECRYFMTRNSSYITESEQQDWFKNKSLDISVFLLYNILDGVISFPVGYALIKKEPDCYSISGGISENYRDKGIGEKLFRCILDKIPEGSVVELEVLKSNIRAQKVYTKIGFVPITDDDRIITMRLEL